MKVFDVLAQAPSRPSVCTDAPAPLVAPGRGLKCDTQPKVMKVYFAKSRNEMKMVIYMGVSKNRGTQNGWFIMENLIKMDDLGGPPLFLETPISVLKMFFCLGFLQRLLIQLDAGLPQGLAWIRPKNCWGNGRSLMPYIQRSMEQSL